MQQQVRVGVNGLITQLCQRMERAGLEAGRVATGTTHIVEQRFTALDGRIVIVPLRGYTQQRYVRDQDRKSTRLNSSHVAISYAVFCLKKKTDQPNCRC